MEGAGSWGCIMIVSGSRLDALNATGVITRGDKWGDYRDRRDREGNVKGGE